MNRYEDRPIMGNWKIHRLIGVGSYGRVYEIWQDDGEFKAALKIISIPQDEADYRDAVKSFGGEEAAQNYFTQVRKKLVSEIKLLYELKGHTNIVGYQNHAIVDHEDGFGWDILIQMELLNGLHEHFGRGRYVTSQDVIKLGMDISLALEHCQKFNIVHRDIKPDNIMVSEAGDYKLGDFGVSCILHDDRTRRMSKKGTEYYMAPELVYPDRESDSRVDIYSLGIVMYKLLNANRFPLLPNYPQEYDVIADENKAYIQRIRGDKLPAPMYAAGTRLGEIVLKACEADRDKRYFSPHELYEDLKAIALTEEDRVIFDVIRNPGEDSWTYVPTNLQEKRANIHIVGNHGSFPFDGTEKKVLGFTADVAGNDISVQLAPGAKALAQGVNPGKYPMGLTAESFQVVSNNTSIRIGTVTVEDGWLEISPKAEAAPKSEPKPKRRWWIIPVILLVLALLAGGIFGAVSLLRGRDAQVPETVPPLQEEILAAEQTEAPTEVQTVPAEPLSQEEEVRVRVQLWPRENMSPAQMEADREKIFRRMEILSGREGVGEILDNGDLQAFIPFDRIADMDDAEPIFNFTLAAANELCFLKRTEAGLWSSDLPITRDMIESIDVVTAKEMHDQYGMPMDLADIVGKPGVLLDDQWCLKVKLTQEGVDTQKDFTGDWAGDGYVTMAVDTGRRSSGYHTTMYDAGDRTFILLDNAWNLPEQKAVFETLKECYLEEPLSTDYDFAFRVRPVGLWEDPAQVSDPGKLQQAELTDEMNLVLSFSTMDRDPVTDHDLMVRMKSIKDRLDIIGTPYVIGLSPVYEQQIRVGVGTQKLSYGLLELLTQDYVDFQCLSRSLDVDTYLLKPASTEIVHNEEDDSYALKVTFDDQENLRKVTGQMTEIRDKEMCMTAGYSKNILAADVIGYAQNDYLLFDHCPLLNLQKIDEEHRYVLELVDMLLNQKSAMMYDEFNSFYLESGGKGIQPYESMEFGEGTVREKEEAVLTYIEENYPKAEAYYKEDAESVTLYVKMNLPTDQDFIKMGIDQTQEIYEACDLENTVITDAFFYLIDEEGSQRCRLVFSDSDYDNTDHLGCTGLCFGDLMNGYAEQFEKYAKSKYFYQIRDFQMWN